MSLHYNGDISYLFANGKETCNFKSSYKNVNFLLQFCLGSISKKFDYVEAEVGLKGSAYDFSVDYEAIDKSDILNMNNKNGII